MPDDQRTPGSTAHAYRGRLFWEWCPAMPGTIPGGFKTLLYAMASAAGPDGVLTFARSGKPITLGQLAKGAGVDVKDARRYVQAAVAAGVVIVVKAPRHGVPAVYAVALCPDPDWEAARVVLLASRRVRSNKPAPFPKASTVSRDEKDSLWLGGQPPDVEDEPDEPWSDEVGGTAPPTGWGDSPPMGWGDSPPNNQGYGFSMTVAEEITQAEVPSDHPPENDSSGEERWGTTVRRCPRCGARMADRRGREACASCLRAEAAQQGPGGR